MNRILLPIAALVVAQAVSAGPVLVDHEPRVLVEAPSEVVAGEPFEVGVLVSSRWGPEGPEVPSGALDRALTLRILSPGEPPREISVTNGRARAGVSIATPGLHRVEVVATAPDDTLALATGESNPVRVLAKAPAERILWGDLHAHLHTPGHGHAGVIAPARFAEFLVEGFAWGREVSALDFGAFTPHIQTAGGLARRGPGGTSPWDELLRVVEEAHAPGEFVTFPGFEWQGDEGDHCVILPGPRPLAAPASFLALADSVDAAGGLLTAHGIFLPTRFEPRTPVLAGVEVTRDSQSIARLGRESLRRGVVTAFLGCSDTHGGALGSTSLTGVRAAARTRTAILDAIGARRTWATNGERIVLETSLDTGAEVPTLRVRGMGTGPIDIVEIFRDGRSIARLRGFGQALEFDFDWEDDDLFRLDCLDGALAYHAEIVQVTANRYDPSRRDVAIASPHPIVPGADHFDAAYRRRGGGAARGPGRDLVRLREALGAFRPASDRPLRAEVPPGTEPPAFRDADVAALERAADDFVRLAADDPILAPLSRLVARLPAIVRAYRTARDFRPMLRAAYASGPPDETALRRLRAQALAAHALATRAGGGEREETILRDAWFVARLVPALTDEVLAELERLGRTELGSRRVELSPVGSDGDRRALVDPRLLVAGGASPERARTLRREFEERWGYTSPSPEPTGPGLRFRVTAPGPQRGARLSGGTGSDAWEVPLEREGDAWVATVASERLPAPGEPPIVLRRAPQAGPGHLRVEPVPGTLLPALGRVSRTAVLQTQDPRQAEIDVVGDSVEVMVRNDDRVLWRGVLPPGRGFVPVPSSNRNLIALPSARTLAEEVEVHWGLAGWARRGGTELPGHEAARPSALGALDDGRAVVAFTNELVLVDPVAGDVRRFPYPDVRHEAGREMSLVEIDRDLLLVRGAQGPGGGWVRVLALASGRWGMVPTGPETGTVAATPNGGYAWLTGTTLSFRTRLGFDLAPERIDASGRLLGFDPLGRAVIRTARDEAVRVELETGEIVDRVHGTILGHDPSGAILVLDGFDTRHPELAREVRVVLALPDGTRTGPFGLAVKASPVLDPPILVAGAPDGDLFVLGGTTWWRREPEHDWWGSVVERWEPIWAGSRTAR